MSCVRGPKGTDAELELRRFGRGITSKRGASSPDAASAAAALPRDITGVGTMGEAGTEV